MSIPVTTPPDKISSAPESQAQELYSVLLKVWIEVMDFPPRQPSSTDSYLPHEFIDEIISTLEKISRGNPELPKPPKIGLREHL
ncbi:hypothetical protein [Ferrovum sp.]|uniref:hypothetical protein n=1 Tax=Ferrovum sp. TaxID=2609467 RepID=UPI002629FA01|nr:hypothetical protein [Ferrovum sp.]